MLRKISQVIAVLVLLLLPFYPITENFFPPERQVNNQTFWQYIAICTAIILVGLLFIVFLKPNRALAGWLLFFLGFSAMIPLHLGPPRMGGDLLTSTGIEQFRYGMLIVATVLLFVAGLRIMTPAKDILSKIFLGILLGTLLLNLWDNYSSFMLGPELKSWMDKGKNPDDFFTQYDFHIAWRTLARISLYVTAIAIAWILLKKSILKKWQFAALTIFSLIGIGCCIRCLQTDFRDFYFPFMVPAIALAPAYWIGITMLCKKETTGGKIHA